MIIWFFQWVGAAAYTGYFSLAFSNVLTGQLTSRYVRERKKKDPGYTAAGERIK